jgi:predicted glycoside hydrolase/deacetylase ChbG (UPF0249 family)
VSVTDQPVLVVNADDFGASPGINRGIVEAHERGILTSTSLMVRAAGAEQAVALARRHPGLSLGLHWDLDAGGSPVVDFEDAAAVRRELAAQLDRFRELVGRGPTHLDSHHNVHRDSPGVAEAARELAASLRVPLRYDGQVRFIGGFYGQWEWQVTDLQHVGVEFLAWLLRHEVGPGWTEIGCHPGYITPDFHSAYRFEREAELATLTDPRVREEIAALGIRLAGFAELSA